jgi:hypothetical protein
MDKESIKEREPIVEDDSSEESSSDSSIQIPEAFQKEVSVILSKCKNEQMLDYLMDCCQEKQSEYSEEFSDEDEPQD